MSVPEAPIKTLSRSPILWVSVAGLLLSGALMFAPKSAAILLQTPSVPASLVARSSVPSAAPSTTAPAQTATSSAAPVRQSSAPRIASKSPGQITPDEIARIDAGGVPTLHFTDGSSMIVDASTRNQLQAGVQFRLGYSRGGDHAP
jgi:hypothetical protein